MGGTSSTSIEGEGIVGKGQFERKRFSKVAMQYVATDLLQVKLKLDGTRQPVRMFTLWSILG